jgi:hypothetical protein
MDAIKPVATIVASTLLLHLRLDLALLHLKERGHFHHIAGASGALVAAGRRTTSA